MPSRPSRMNYYTHYMHQTDRRTRKLSDYDRLRVLCKADHETQLITNTEQAHSDSADLLAHCRHYYYLQSYNMPPSCPAMVRTPLKASWSQIVTGISTRIEGLVASETSRHSISLGKGEGEGQGSWGRNSAKFAVHVCGLTPLLFPLLPFPFRPLLSSREADTFPFRQSLLTPQHP